MGGIINNIILLIVFLIFLAICFLYDFITIILLVIFLIFFVIFFSYYFFTRIKNKSKLKFVNCNDVEKVKNYYNKKVHTLLNEENDEIELYDAFEIMNDVCGFFLKMDKNIGYKRNEIFMKEDLEQIKNINSKNLNKFYKETEQILDIIFKYYDENGNRRI